MFVISSLGALRNYHQSQKFMQQQCTNGVADKDNVLDCQAEVWWIGPHVCISFSFSQDSWAKMEYTLAASQVKSQTRQVSLRSTNLASCACFASSVML